MALSVKTTIFPLRVSFKNRENWDFVVDISNTGEKTAMVLFEMELPSTATFTQTGYATRFEKRWDSVKPGQQISLKLPIFVSRNGNPGNYEAKLNISEHMGEYGYVTNKYNKEVLLRIVP